jgi:hypothetical protein
MLSDLAPIIFALAGAALVYALRERHRRATRVRPPRPDIAIEEAWGIWRATAPDAADEALPELAATAARAAEAVHPRVFLRNAALESALMALHLEAIAALPHQERAMLLKGYTPDMDGLLRETQRAHATRWMALRFYLRLKYDDAVPEDWLDHFRQVAAPYVREKVRLARDYLVQVDPSAGRFAEIYDELLDGLRKEMLRVPPKQRFPPADL